MPFFLQMHRFVLHSLEHLQPDLVNLLHGLNYWAASRSDKVMSPRTTATLPS